MTTAVAQAVPTTTTLAPLQSILDELGLSCRDLARGASLSFGSAWRLVSQGTWPARDRAAKGRVAACLRERGAKAQHWAALRTAGIFDVERLFSPAPTTTHPENEKAPAGLQTAGATPEAATKQPAEEDQMLLENVALTPQAREHFNLARSPFMDDVGCRDDVFASPATRYVRAALMDCALNHGFIAVIGESGSGKTTLREELEERIRDEGKPVVVIKPYVLAMEPNDIKGKQMKSGQIAEAIARTLAPSLQLKSSPEARFRQVHELLRDSCRAGTRHLLVIEEAHRMPIATLKHLKGWMELKDGLRRLIGVCLIGQPELGGLLSEQRAEIREIVQRCEKVALGPLDMALEGYIKHKFARVGADAADVLEPDAYDAIRARLWYVPQNGRPQDAHSVCYPLAVNNLLARAMRAAAGAGWPKVDAQAVAGC